VSSCLAKDTILSRNVMKIDLSWVLLAHTCNPSYSEGSNQDDSSSKPAQANSLQDPFSKTLHKINK
jgi:hypothetical protein